MELQRALSSWDLEWNLVCVLKIIFLSVLMAAIYWFDISIVNV